MSKDLNIDFFSIKYNNIPPKKGSVLISEPFSVSPIFKRSIILLTEHSDKEGTLGFILNKPIEADIKEIDELFIEDKKPYISIGGPVNPERVFYIHTLGDKKIPNSINVFDNIYWGGDFEILKELILAGVVTTKDIKFFIGYSGWDKNQLQSEINKNYWLVTQLSSKQIMSQGKSLWNTSVHNIGKRYKIWSNFPEDPIYN